MSILTERQAVEAALDAARWAPSVHNTQPWSFAVKGDEIALRADVDRQLRVEDVPGRELLISCGAALYTMRTALRCAGFEPVVRVLPDPDRPSLVATVRPGAPAEPDELTLLMGGEIERRRTHRAAFTDLTVPERLLDALALGAMGEGARLAVVGEPTAVEVIAALTRAAQGVQAQDRRFTLEVIRWARPPAASRSDGVPAGAYPRTAPRTDPFFPQRDYAWRHDWGTEPDRSATSAGVVAVLTTARDGREDWITAGQALQRVLLHASAHDVSAAFHTQALEMHHLREFLRHELLSGEFPQMIMRLGITFEEKESVRRPLSDLLG
ncbi:Acg family FMN-binding oxidoreductase [Nonomuraea pusilla]|uniref:Nitroreductase family protein n=1 Tax=Nonomuraea pusilla TaxID=46177 RepID=A0A1H7X393_9ACTN|nr:nitroreductase family protein [Nonomuraea pusilla]SEM27667.1 Nitroreductase family protein [Nonomuraea pusilla]